MVRFPHTHMLAVTYLAPSSMEQDVCGALRDDHLLPLAVVAAVAWPHHGQDNQDVIPALRGHVLKGRTVLERVILEPVG